jgi:hypothetical protein
MISTDVDNEDSFLRESELWAINSDGTNERLLISLEDLRTIQPEDPSVVIHDLEWIPDSHLLLFNTEPNFPYPHKPLDDLYIVNADTSEWSTLLLPGEGGSFFPSPDGQRIAVTSQTTIQVINIDGSDQRLVFTHAEVPIFGEGWYHASPIWAPDGNSLTAAIPSSDPFNNPVTSIWQIPLDDEEPSVISTIETDIAFTPGEGFISPDAAWVINPIFGPDDSDHQVIQILSIDGTLDMEIDVGDNHLYLSEWAPNSEHFSISGRHADSILHLGSLGNDSLLPISNAILERITWIDASTFLYHSGSFENPQLSLGQIGKSSFVLIKSDEPYDFIQYDFSQ